MHLAASNKSKEIYLEGEKKVMPLQLQQLFFSNATDVKRKRRGEQIVEKSFVKKLALIPKLLEMLLQLPTSCGGDLEDFEDPANLREKDNKRVS